MRFLFVDRILALSSSSGSVCGIKHVTPADFYLSSDESGRPCFMSALIGETLGQMTAWAVMAQNEFRMRPVAGIVESVILERPAYVGETLALESWIDRLDDQVVQYHGEVRIGSELIFRLEGALGPMLPMDEFIDPIVAQRQFAEINRPGDWPYIPSASPLALAKAHPAFALEFDHILETEPGVRLKAAKHVTRAAPYFPDHFPYKPVLPLTVLLECKMNLAKLFLTQAGWTEQYRIYCLRKIKMSEFVYPGDVVVCEASLKSRTTEECIIRFTSRVGGKRICVVEMVLIGVGAQV